MSAKLLIVEDDQDISDILYREFSSGGFDVYRAWSGTEDRLALTNSPDLIILDLTLPGIQKQNQLSLIAC